MSLLQLTTPDLTFNRSSVPTASLHCWDSTGFYKYQLALDSLQLRSLGFELCVCVYVLLLIRTIHTMETPTVGCQIVIYLLVITQKSPSF